MAKRRPPDQGPPPPSPPAGVERAPVWQSSFAGLYEQVLVGPLFEPWVDPLLAQVRLGPGDRLLDVACGTGIVARIARQRLGAAATVVAVNASAQMLAVARRVGPTIDWREGDAAALPLGDAERFDVLVCQQGFQFFADAPAAARQMHRALVQGGRLGVSTWRPDEESAVLRQLRQIAEEHVGAVVDRRHALGDPAALEATLRHAGFGDVRSQRWVRTVRFRDGSSFVRLNAMALVGMASPSPAAGDEARRRLIDAIVRDSADLVRSHTDEAGFAYEVGTNVTLAFA